ncbi:EAL domain-containing protein [Aeromicrobium sp. CFBP 8757]|uniref:sensor domain-containing protein n=1 Tax=Aeromicrobium sp. CFBP 8757 TaxID=2775288 RepID=UPI00177B3C64|nr:EAL domain-containing protein [Aeromicrobium sp. CFBP 8757]MBD8606015.1 EAL domain-containing protein [Aeromicrobium sp. CFBP 8757]
MHSPHLATTVTVSAQDGTILRADAGLVVLMGLCPADLIGHRLETFGATRADAENIAECVAAAAEGDTGQAQVALRSDDVDELYVQLVATAVGHEIVVAVIDETDRVHEERDLASEQRRWQSLVRNAADIVFTIQDDGTLTSVTSALPRRLGWEIDDVVGVLGLQFVHPDDRPAAQAAWQAVATRRSAQETLEVRLVHADRTVSWSRIVVSDLRDDPDVRAVVGNSTDITEQKLVQLQQRREEARFRARFEQSRLPQTMHSPDETFVAVNDAFCTLVGRSRNELIGRPMSWIMHADDVAPELGSIETARLEGVETLQRDRVLRADDGSPIAVRADITVLRDADGEPSGCAAVLHDQRPLQDSERARMQLQQFFDVVADRSRDFVVMHDAAGSTIYASPPGLRMFGQRYDQPIHEQVQAIHPDDFPDSAAQWQRVLTHTESHTWRFRVRDADDAWRWIEQTSTNLLDTEVGGIVSTVRDVTAEVAAQKALSTSEARYRAMAETAEEGMLVISPDGLITYANVRIGAMLGLDVDAVLGTPVFALLRGEHRDLVEDRVHTRQDRGSERFQVTFDHPDGSPRRLHVAASPMPDVDGVRQGSLAMISDITDSLRAVDELRHAAQHDSLTGLSNRKTLMDHLDTIDLRSTSRVAVLFIDLDHFKDVNDGRGHSAGDDVLVEVAARLLASTDGDDVVARFGGDEFIVVMHDVDEQVARYAASTILKELSGSYHVGHHTIRVGATIGVALSPAESSEHLVRFADSAMYAAKTGGRGRVRVFDSELAAQTEERHVVSGELLAALENDALDMHYQPVIDVSTGEVVGVEALARWHHPTLGEIRPERFVALAELSASSTDVDRWAIRRALRDVSELRADLTMPDDMYVAINLSGQSLSDESLADYIVDSVAAAGLEPSTVMLEITESAIMTDQNLAIAILQRLRNHGFDIALDDFGTGYSSMAYLRDLPISVLKIDRGFITDIPEDAHSLAIVRSLIELGRSLGLKVVAEGVETQAHLDALRVRGCGLAQGWLWSPAVPVETLRSSRILTDRFAADVVETDPA